MKNIDQLDRKLKRDIRWCSHVPTHRAILKSFPITGIMELGAGMNSTYEFFKHDIDVISIETDKKWIDTIKEDLIETDKHKIIYHDIGYPNITRSTLEPDYPKDIYPKALNFYHTYLTKNLNLLFVDSFAGLRYNALQNLYSGFDIVTYHDAEAPKLYGYDKFINEHNFIHYIDKTFIAWTGILIHPKFNKYIDTFMGEYDDARKIHAARFDINAPVIIERI